MLIQIWTRRFCCQTFTCTGLWNELHFFHLHALFLSPLWMQLDHIMYIGFCNVVVVSECSTTLFLTCVLGISSWQFCYQTFSCSGLWMEFHFLATCFIPWSSVKAVGPYHAHRFLWCCWTRVLGISSWCGLRMEFRLFSHMLYSLVLCERSWTISCT